MTIICAIHGHGETWIGSDTMRVRGGCLIRSLDHKWVKWGQWWIGATGPARSLDLIRNAAAQTKLSRLENAFELSGLIRRLFEADGFQGNLDKRMLPDFGTTFLFVAPDRSIYDVDTSFASTLLPAEALASNGCGASEADGAAFAMRSMRGVTVEKIIKTAIEAAIYFDSSCGGEIFIQKVHGR